jgi:V/A-type H+/Na+-transporting ATPase subunit C
LLFKRLAKKLKNKFIINFVNLRINLINLRIFLRLKKSGLVMPEFLKEVLIEEGEITIDEFISLANQELSIILYHLAKKFPPNFAKYFSDYLEHHKFWLLEKRLFEEEIDYLRKAKSIAYGPEIVTAYFYAKRNANKNIRLIMNGKLNQMDNLILKERVRKIY